MCQVWAEEGLAIQPIQPQINFTSQEREQAVRFSRVDAWERQPRLWSLQICCKTPRRVTNPGHLNSKQHSPALEGKPKQTPPAEGSVQLHLNFCSCFTFTLGQGLHPLPHQASCSCQPFCEEWLVSAIPTGNAQPPHHLYSPCHVGTTVTWTAL